MPHGETGTVGEVNIAAVAALKDVFREPKRKRGTDRVRSCLTRTGCNFRESGDIGC